MSVSSPAVPVAVGMYAAAVAVVMTATAVWVAGVSTVGLGVTCPVDVTTALPVAAACAVCVACVASWSLCIRSTSAPPSPTTRSSSAARTATHARSRSGRCGPPRSWPGSGHTAAADDLSPPPWPSITLAASCSAWPNAASDG